MQIDAPPKDGEANAALLDYMSSVRVHLLRTFSIESIKFWTSDLLIPLSRFVNCLGLILENQSRYAPAVCIEFTELSYVEISDI